MSSSATRNGEHVVQDFIARIRYSNALPPPPNPPKLLDIPNTGLASGQYTTPGFASRLAREQPLNIEADAELGMPLDLVGLPGIFDGDESSIQAPAQMPPTHPHDRPLLRPLATLGKPKVDEATVSFLRRTEYISSNQKGHSHSSSALNAFRPNKQNVLKRPQKRRSPESEAGTPSYVKRKVERSFQVAQQALKDRSRVQHPSLSSKGKIKGLRAVEAYPLLPDLEALPDSGGYVTVKFGHPPVIGPNGTYDHRLLSSILKPRDPEPEVESEYIAAREAWLLDPDNVTKPVNPMVYDLYLPENMRSARQFWEKFDINNPERDDENLYTDASGVDDSRCFAYGRIRTYNTTDEQEFTRESKYSEEIILSLSEDPRSKKKTGWYYPVAQTSKIDPPRDKRINKAMAGIQEDEDDPSIIDELEVTIEDPPPQIREMMEHHKQNPYLVPGGDEEEQDEDEEEAQEASQNGEHYDQEEHDDHDDREDIAGAEAIPANGNHSGDDEEDAEGDEED